jgi:hypothetical protein
MKINSRLFTFIITIIGGIFLMINLKINFFDSVWDYFFAIQIFVLNSYEFVKFLKLKKNEKNI